MTRFEKADADLSRWRATQPSLLQGLDLTPDVESVFRAVDAAFKSEVLEYRIRAAVNAQSLNEAEVSHVPPHSTLTGVHRWDFDWWLTEATARALHAGIDAIAQLLNVVFVLGADRNSTSIASDVAGTIAIRNDLADVSAAVVSMWTSPECGDLRAFVNHVKRSGFPERTAQSVPDGLGRATSVGQFAFDSSTYGPWTPGDIETMFDGYRRHAIAILEAAARARAAV